MHFRSPCTTELIKLEDSDGENIQNRVREPKTAILTDNTSELFVFDTDMILRFENSEWFKPKVEATTY